LAEDDKKREEKPQGKTFYDYPPKEWADFLDQLSSILERLGTKYIQYEESKAKGGRRIAYPIFFIITLIFVSVSFLVGIGKVDAGIFTVVVGVMVGYLLSFLGDYLVPQPSS
jgi:hypothetical protein